MENSKQNNLLLETQFYLHTRSEVIVVGWPASLAISHDFLLDAASEHNILVAQTIVVKDTPRLHLLCKTTADAVALAKKLDGFDLKKIHLSGRLCATLGLGADAWEPEENFFNVPCSSSTRAYFDQSLDMDSAQHFSPRSLLDADVQQSISWKKWIREINSRANAASSSQAGDSQGTSFGGPQSSVQSTTVNRSGGGLPRVEISDRSRSPSLADKNSRSPLPLPASRSPAPRDGGTGSRTRSPHVGNSSKRPLPPLSQPSSQFPRSSSHHTSHSSVNYDSSRRFRSPPRSSTRSRDYRGPLAYSNKQSSHQPHHRSSRPQTPPRHGPRFAPTTSQSTGNAGDRRGASSFNSSSIQNHASTPTSTTTSVLDGGYTIERTNDWHDSNQGRPYLKYSGLDATLNWANDKTLRDQVDRMFGFGGGFVHHVSFMYELGKNGERIPSLTLHFERVTGITPEQCLGEERLKRIKKYQDGK